MLNMSKTDVWKPVSNSNL